VSLGKKFEKRLPPRARWICRALRSGDIQRDAVISHAQEGEDLALLRYFRKRREGFYVDVGAHHPTRFSNTWAFYQRGWSGINIDPLPGTAAAFSRLRPRDITLETGVFDQAGELVYHRFQEPAFNTFSPAAAQAAEAKGALPIGTVSIPVDTLTSILDRHLPQGRHIDFMSIDVEGLDEAVIRSLDFSKYRPEVLIVEMIGADLEEVLTSNLYLSLRQKNYRAHAKTGNSVILIDQHPHD
jgi:FkbM family methyltransferase